MSKMNLIKISNLIRTKRKELGMTQDELAEKLFVTEKAISRWKPVEEHRTFLY